MLVASVLNEAHVQFSLPPFPGATAALRANAALEAQPELAGALGVPITQQFVP
jgi:hypothetical protein